MPDIGPSTPLPGSERHRPAPHRYVGPADPDKLIGVTVVVRPRPGSPPLPDLQQWHDTPLRERRAVSRDEYARVHRAAQADLTAVGAFAAAHGLRTVDVRRDPKTFEVTADGPTETVSLRCNREVLSALIRQCQDAIREADLCRPPDEYPVTVRRIDPAAVTA
jgi:hypothetical protein